MKRAPVTLFIALVLLVGVGGIWLMSDAGGSRPLGLSSDSTEALIPDGDPIQPEQALVELTSDLTSAAAGRAPSPVPESAPRRSSRGWAPPATARWVEGRVESEDGLPLDEEMIVVAEGRAFASDPERSDTFRAKVKGDGRFRVAFSPDTLSGRILLEGRYAYLSKPEIVKPRKLEDGEQVVLDVELGGRIEVEVLPPKSVAFAEDAIAGIEVGARVGDWSRYPALDGRSIGTATFELGGARPDQAYDVQATSPLHADGKLESVRVEAGQTTRVSVELSRGARLAGTVRNNQGEPILGGKIMAMSHEEARARNPFFNRDVTEVSEIVAGQFELLGVRPGETMLVVEADGYLEHKEDLGELFDGDERGALSILLSRGGVISGMVRWPDGEAAVGAEVRISQAGAMGSFDFESIHDKTILGPDGGFSFSALKEGICAVTAVCVERGWELPEDATLSERKFGKRPPAWRVHEENLAPGTTNLVLVLQPGSNIRGLVVDDAGEPVEKFRVIASPSDVGFLSSNGVRSVKERFEDKLGRFELPGLMAGSWKVRVSATGYGQGDERTIRAPFEGELRLSMPRAGVLEGLVRTPDGSSPKGARVLIEHGNDRKLGVDVNRDGGFKASKVEPGKVTLTASMEDFAKSLPIELVVGAAGRRESLTLDLRPGARIIGELHESVGKLEGRTVRIQGPTSASKESAEDGSFEFAGLDPGRYEVILTPQTDGLEGRARWMFSRTNQRQIVVELAVGQVETIVLGEPPATAVRVTGRVMDEGTAVPRAVVTVYAKDATSGGEALSAAQADLDGAYALVVDEPGDYRFEVGRDFGKLSSVEVKVPGVEEFRHDFQLPQLQLRGKVVGPDGAPVGDVFLTLSSGSEGAQSARPWMQSQQAQSIQDGTFLFEDLSAGSYELRVATFRGRTDLANILVRGVKVTTDGDPNLQVDLPLGGEVQGFVQDSQGEPVNRATIYVETEDGLRISEFGRTRSGQDGSFNKRSIAPGDAWLRAEKNGRKGNAIKLGIAAGGVTQATLTVPAE